MLLGKHRGGNQNRHLLAVHDGLHHGAEGDFGFTEAHVATEKTVHGDGGLHVVLDVCDAAKLVVGLRVGEIVLKFLLPFCIRRKLIACSVLSDCVKLHQFLCNICNSTFNLAFCFTPLLST